MHSEVNNQASAPAPGHEHTMHASEDVPDGTPTVKGYDFNNGINYDELFKAYRCSGFQATNMAKAIDEINRMIKWRLSDEPIPETDDPINNFFTMPVNADGKELPRSHVKCKIFLGYTSNMISCGTREVIRFLVEHKFVDVIVTSAGGIEEDLMKCMQPTYMGDFKLKGKDLRSKGINRIGNLLIPNKTYCQFEDWMNPLLDEMLKEQKEDGVNWTPSKMIRRFGKEINDESSVLYWAYKNDIPIYSPALTDGSIGDMLYFHSFNNPGLRLDLVEDIRGINMEACDAARTGIIILGGGLIKHHICNANMLRNGTEYAVYINTGQEFDGSDSGARPDEAVSWGKIKATANPVKVFGDASLIFPLVVSQTFAKQHQLNLQAAANQNIDK